MKKILIITILMFTSIEFIMIINQAMYHEYTHVIIFKTFGDCDTRIEPYFRSVADNGFMTYAWNCSYKNQNEEYLQKSLNLQNEIAGYNIFGIILAILMTGEVMTVVWLIEKERQTQPSQKPNMVSSPMSAI